MGTRFRRMMREAKAKADKAGAVHPGADLAPAKKAATKATPKKAAKKAAPKKATRRA